MSPDPHHYRYSRYSHGSRRGTPSWKRTLRTVFSKGFFANALLGLIILVVVGFIGAVLLFALVGRNLPDPNALQDRSVAQSTKIYDRTGEHLLYEIHGDQKRTLVPLSDIPPQVVQAFLSAEDDDFYSHNGIDIRGIVRATLANAVSGSKSQGASTL
ncbi:MAG: transglycosylase domain-containing protein, partial [Patescibacteria group bacterium]